MTEQSRQHCNLAGKNQCHQCLASCSYSLLKFSQLNHFIPLLTFTALSDQFFL
ncbi:hypothetical protein Plhal304r1_c012g0048061 [Plasmopara halstedii]